MMSNNKLIALTGLLSMSVAAEKESVAAEKSPNFIVIFADDMGYGDVGIYGHPTIKTPNLDQMAVEGQKWTSFYAAAPVSTPSRAGLLTGRLPIRSGMCSEKRRVLFPNSKGGLPQTEITIASALKKVGYATACVGKWHLGHLPGYRPNDHGFDYYYGIPYSNDMDNVGSNYQESLTKPKIEYFNVPLMRNTDIIERPADQTTISQRYTKEAVKFISENKNKPFFLYLAHSMPHVPLFRSKDFENRSLAGIYGDVIEELDWSVGQVLNAVKENGLDDNTIVVFTSDNGPWLIFNQHGGSAGLLRGGKGGTWEGGMREPAIFWCPGKIKPKVVADIGATLDLLPTFCKLAKVDLPSDRVYDGYDISPVLFGTGSSPRTVMMYYRDTNIYAVRKGEFKAHFATRSEYGNDPEKILENPLLFNLNHDPSESNDIASKYPEVIKELRQVIIEHNSTISPVENQLEK